MKDAEIIVKEAVSIRKMLNGMNNTKMPIKTAEKIVRLTDELNIIYSDYSVEMDTLYKDVAVKDGEGNYIQGDDGKPQIKPERAQEFKSRKRTIEAKKVTVPVIIEMPDVETLDVTPNELRLLKRIML